MGKESKCKWCNTGLVNKIVSVSLRVRKAGVISIVLILVALNVLRFKVNVRNTEKIITASSS
jgi:hypothetical protein